MRRVLLLLTLVSACGGAPARAPARPAPPAPARPAASPAVDALGPRPAVSTPAPFAPPVPVVYTRAGGTTVWLFERHTLPLVSVQLVVPAGAASDPADRGGLALATANMLDEGAGRRGALEIARDVDALGAALWTGAVQDYAFVQLTTLAKNLAPALAIWGDVVARPRLSPVEWRRVHALWENELRARQSDPDAVAAVVIQRVAYPAGHPYAHPTSGTLASAAKVTLDDVKRFYAAHWRPDRATVVVVGDVTRAELDPLLDAALGAWKKPPGPPPSLPDAAPGSAGGRGDGSASAGARSPGDGAPPRRRIVVVDRPDAPQSVIAVVAPGVAASAPEAPPLVRVNAALGGSFTSRLNQDLREEHGWSYGARSRFSFARLPGLFAAQAAVQTEHTGDALKVMLADLDAMARSGLTPEEVDKTRLLARAELVESFEGVAGAARRLARSAGVGLGAEHEARASARLDAATADQLAELARAYVDPSRGDIVIVGPRAKIAPQLEAIGMGAVEARGPEGDGP